MNNKSNLQQSSSTVLVDQNNPEALRKKQLQALMKRFGDLIETPSYQPDQQSVHQRTRSVDNTPLKIQLRKKDRIKTNSEFRIYKRALDYSESKRGEIEFNSQFRLRKKIKTIPQSLSQFIDDKETQMSLRKNEHMRNSELAEAFLQDNTVRECILQKALLFQRLYDQRKENKLKDSTQNDVPKRFKGMNPKHMRLPSTPRNQAQFKHMKYIQYQRKLQFFEKSLKAQEKDIQNKWNANNNLINLVVNLNQQYARQKVQTNEDRQLSILFKRLFLHYSNHQTENPDNLYTFVSKERALELLNQFKISTDLIGKQEFRFPLGSFKFQQFIGRISKQKYGQVKFPTRKIMKEIFQPFKEKFVHPLFEYVQINRSQFDHYFSLNMKKSFQMKKIFMKMTNKNCIQSEDRIIFKQIFQKLWNLNIFPNLIPKAAIRFYFQSFNTSSNGILFEEYKTFMLVVILHIYKDGSIFSKLDQFFHKIKPYVNKY